MVEEIAPMMEGAAFSADDERIAIGWIAQGGFIVVEGIVVVAVSGPLDDGARETTSERGEEKEQRFHDGPRVRCSWCLCVF
jgi:hypothetical protein